MANLQARIFIGTKESLSEQVEKFILDMKKGQKMKYELIDSQQFKHKNYYGATLIYSYI